MDDIKAVRLTNAKEATPYLRRWLPKMLAAGMSRNTRCVDLACGNTRNTKYLWESGIRGGVQALDAVPDADVAVYWTASQMIPAPNDSVGLILCQYLLMFLNDNVLHHLMAEIDRVAGEKCVLVVELQKVKQGVRPPDMHEVVRLLDSTGKRYKLWNVIHRTRTHAIFQRPG